MLFRKNIFEDCKEFPEMNGEDQTSLVHLNVLVGEDNPISMRQMNKRLSKRGHQVVLVCDGKECHDNYVSQAENVDVILMDLQVCINCYVKGGLRENGC